MKFTNYPKKPARKKPKANAPKYDPKDLIAEVKPDGWGHKVQFLRAGDNVRVKHGKYDYPKASGFYGVLSKGEARQVRKALYDQGIRGTEIYGV